MLSGDKIGKMAWELGVPDAVKTLAWQGLIQFLAYLKLKMELVKLITVSYCARNVLIQ